MKGVLQGFWTLGAWQQSFWFPPCFAYLLFFPERFINSLSAGMEWSFAVSQSWLMSVTSWRWNRLRSCSSLFHLVLVFWCLINVRKSSFSRTSWQFGSSWNRLKYSHSRSAWATQFHLRYGKTNCRKWVHVTNARETTFCWTRTPTQSINLGPIIISEIKWSCKPSISISHGYNNLQQACWCSLSFWERELCLVDGCWMLDRS